MGTRHVFNAEAHEWLDTARGLSPADRRDAEHRIAQDDARLSQIIKDHHDQHSARIAADVEFVLRVGPEGEARVDEVMEDLRDGTISPREAAKALAEIKADVNRVRDTVAGLPAAEERLWDEVNKSPGEYQRDLARRAPALFRSGRGLLQMPTYDD